MASCNSYESILEDAETADLRVVENADIVRVWPGTDQGSLAVVVITPSHLGDIEPEQAFRLFVRDADSLSNGPYRIVLVNSNHGVRLRQAIWVARRARAILARKFRKNVEAVSIVHPDLFLRVVSYALRPFVSVKFWEKVQFADRIEELELDGTFLHQDLATLLPNSSREYEEILTEESVQNRGQAVALGFLLSQTSEGPDVRRH